MHTVARAHVALVTGSLSQALTIIATAHDPYAPGGEPATIPAPAPALASTLRVRVAPTATPVVLCTCGGAR